MFQRIGLVRLVVACALAPLAAATPAAAGAAVLQPGKDNTLYEDATGSVSNGAGSNFFVGSTAAMQIRRGVLWFDVASVVPPGSLVTAARLTLSMNRAFPGDVTAPIEVHRLTADWGEGSSDADGQEGFGAAADRGDATWLHTFHDTDAWASPGGGYDPTVSASRPVAPAPGPYAWADAGLAADVQSWVDTPAENFGWILIGDETTFGTAKRFASRDHAILPNRPRLYVEFTAPGTGAGRVPESGSDGVPLRLGKLPGGDLQLDWGVSCLGGDLDYAVYEGPIGTFDGHLPVLCSTGGAASASVTPSRDRGYFLVVPVGAGIEGSYGHATGGAERPLGYAACRAQIVTPCP